ncbi:sterol desaturase family protein [Pedobacter nototheniae]|uniref:sterol desaturase family protein n=1 Tax=Pedobacter nototheniae TaxID=2488994 RepID=UPI00292F9FC0|nr:sterol desaturase family protein [Pedobacter nototheniae]
MISVLLNIFVLILTIIFMETFSWFIHKYLFHGPLWFIHKSHHRHKKGFFEWNDVFALLFAAASLYLMFNDRNNFGVRFFIGAGISGYGLIYFIIHDWFIHRRLKTYKSNNKYLLLIRKAHKIHHKNIGKHNGRAFGLLFFNKRVLH